MRGPRPAVRSMSQNPFWVRFVTSRRATAAVRHSSSLWDRRDPHVVPKDAARAVGGASAASSAVKEFTRELEQLGPQSATTTARNALTSSGVQSWKCEGLPTRNAGTAHTPGASMEGVATAVSAVAAAGFKGTLIRVPLKQGLFCAAWAFLRSRPPLRRPFRPRSARCQSPWAQPSWPLPGRTKRKGAWCPENLELGRYPQLHDCWSFPLLIAQRSELT